jgi:hypothetical protein
MVSMVDITNETLIPLREAPGHLPKRPNGKRLHVSACYRWITRGVRGVVLESIRIGGTTYTSLEALQRFGDRLSSAPLPDHDKAPAPQSRQREIERAARRVASELGLTRKPEFRGPDSGDRSPSV